MATSELRPRSATEIVDASFGLLRQSYVPLVTLSVAVQLPLLALRLVGAQATANPVVLSQAMQGTMFGVVLVVGAALALLAIAAQNAVLVGASLLYLGESFQAGAAIGRAVRRFIPLIGVYVLAFLLIALGMLLFIVPGVYVALRLIPLNAVTVLEDGNPFTTIARTWRLGKERIGHMFLTSLLAGLIYGGVAVIGIALVTVLGFAVPVIKDPSVSAIFQTALAALAYPMVIVVSVVLYYDLRIRTEGFDVEMMSRQLGGAPAR